MKNKKLSQAEFFESSASNANFNIEENCGNIVVNSLNGTSASSNTNAFKILQRVPPVPSSTSVWSGNASNNITTPVSYSSVAAAAASPFESQPKVILEDNNRTQFVAPLRILNRPVSKQEVKDARTSEEINKQLMKSFEEKQAEYAKARRRILGEEMPAENLNLKNITESLDQLSVGQTVENSSYNTANKSSNVSLPIIPINNNSGKNDVMIIREPTDPDGTRGFNYVR